MHVSALLHNVPDLSRVRNIHMYVVRRRTKVQSFHRRFLSKLHFSATELHFRSAPRLHGHLLKMGEKCTKPGGIIIIFIPYALSLSCRVTELARMKKVESTESQFE